MGAGKPIFNARAETLSKKTIFRPFLGNRCVIPATAFPEWRKDGKQRFKFRISISGDTVAKPEIMVFAALFDASYYTVITCAVAPRMAPIHSRMPVILPPDAVTKWLDPDCKYQEAASVMVPYLGDDLSMEEDVAPEIVAQSSQADLFS
jgi:putative SOS response-associated peptidase YedK